jgi:hypothetical protein
MGWDRSSIGQALLALGLAAAVWVLFPPTAAAVLLPLTAAVLVPLMAAVSVLAITTLTLALVFARELRGAAAKMQGSC